jgi:hypothetical protein
VRFWVLLLVMSCSSSKREISSCWQDAECPGGRCILGRCRAALGEDNASCEFSADCASKFCVDDRCASGQLGAACRAGVHCASEICRAGRCDDNNAGESCRGAEGECRGKDMQCFRGTCRRLGAAGVVCDLDGDCGDSMHCVDNTCMSDDDVNKRETRLAAEERQRDAAAERRMLTESGVKPDPKQVEKATRPPGRGQRVRTVSVSGEGSAFAACRSDERLVGGGCKPDAVGYPSDYSPDDTVGARWNCTNGYDVTAYALCM